VRAAGADAALTTTSVGWEILNKTDDRTTWDNLVTTAGAKLWPAAAV
jgi:hypothetical protein